MENYNFLPEYVSHMKEIMQEEFHVVVFTEDKVNLNNKELLNFLNN